MSYIKNIVLLFLFLLFSLTVHASENTQKPNILIIWGDDIGPFNISAYNRGMMGYNNWGQSELPPIKRTI